MVRLPLPENLMSMGIGGRSRIIAPIVGKAPRTLSLELSVIPIEKTFTLTVNPI